MLPHTTKNDLYAEIAALGHKKGYFVIPEFRVTIPARSPQERSRKKNIDLVWARRLTDGRQTDSWERHWCLIATFEIEACDVATEREFKRHISDLPSIRNFCPPSRIHHYVALYTTAYDRSWNFSRPFLAEIRERRKLSSGSGVRVLDGRNLSELEKL